MTHVPCRLAKLTNWADMSSQDFKEAVQAVQNGWTKPELVAILKGNTVRTQ
jgi:hypothetical protein